ARGRRDRRPSQQGGGRKKMLQAFYSLEMVSMARLNSKQHIAGSGGAQRIRYGKSTDLRESPASRNGTLNVRRPHAAVSSSRQISTALARARLASRGERPAASQE